MKLKMIGLLGALAIATPAAAIAAPMSGLTAQTAVATTADSAPGTTAKIDKVWWRGGYGWRGGWRGYGVRRFGYGYGYGYGPRVYYGYGRPFFHRRFYY